VLVRVRASSLNFRDMLILNGAYPAPIPAGRFPLSDGSGEVVELGAGVKRVKVGARVINAFFPNFFGGAINFMPEQWVVDHDGWLTEYNVVGAAVTAWSALSGVRAGDTVLTQGTGRVSLFAL
jgi:NADPH:quinone reductase-like Zn-dependent oxidoreductase